MKKIFKNYGGRTVNSLICAFAVSAAVSAAAAAYSDGVQADLRNNLIRMHIIANSDSEADQAVKLAVRDRLLDDIGKKLSTQSGERCKADIINNISDIEKTAGEVLRENGFDYGAKAVYGKFEFPKKEYKNMTLPAGEYYGVRVILGNGAGKNWWCVMYPPLCVSDGGEARMSAESERLLRESLSGEAYDVIAPSDGEITVKFKIVEIFQELKAKTAENK